MRIILPAILLLFAFHSAHALISRADVAHVALEEDKAKVARSILNALEAGKPAMVRPFLEEGVQGKLEDIHAALRALHYQPRGSFCPLIKETAAAQEHKFYRLYYERGAKENVPLLQIEVTFDANPYRLTARDIQLRDFRASSEKLDENSVLYLIKCGKAPPGPPSMSMLINLETGEIEKPEIRLSVSDADDLFKVEGLDRNVDYEVHLNMHRPRPEVLNNEALWAINNVVSLTVTTYRPEYDEGRLLANLCRFTRLRRLEVWFQCYGNTRVGEEISPHQDPLFDCLDAMKNLESITLRPFHGAFPEVIGELEGLTELDITAEFTSLPENIGKLKHLKTLKVTNAKLSSLPESIFRLSNLEHLYLRTPLVEEIPEEVRRLKQLRRLELFGMDALAAFPRALGELEHLARMDVSYMPALPVPKGELVHLDTLKVEKVEDISPVGQYTGVSYLSLEKIKNETFPAGFSRLQNLASFYIEDSGQLKGFPDGLPPFPNLRVVSFIKTGLKEIPGFLLKSTRLESLSIENAQVARLPEGLSNLSNLKNLSLPGNNIEVLPASLMDLRSCSRMDFHSNNIREIAPEILNYRGETSLRISIGGNPVRKEGFENNSTIIIQ